MEEFWKPVAGYEGNYEVSSLGRVRGVERQIAHRHGGGWATRKSAILKIAKGGSGYYHLQLVLDKAKKTHLIHRLVAAAFLEPSDLPQVNHKDFDRSNNCASNLEWVSALENMAHFKAAGGYCAETNPNRAPKLNFDKAEQIRADRANGMKFKDVATKYGISHAMAQKVVYGKFWVRTDHTAGPAGTELTTLLS